MPFTELKEERENAQVLIETYTSQILENRDREQYEFALLGLTSFLRTRAVARFAIDADIPGFRLDLMRSARCQLFYYCHVQMNMKYTASMGAITNDGPFFDALAAGSERDAYLLSYYQTAVALPQDLRSPRFPYNMFLRSKVCENVPRRPSYQSANVEEWLSSGTGTRAAVCRAMAAQDSAAFRHAMRAFVDEWRQQADDPGAPTTDQLLSIEALGVCWLAQAKCGIRVDIDDPLVPQVLLSGMEPLPVPTDIPLLTASELAELEQSMAELHGLTVEEFRRRRPDPRT